jgi:hypothetical protein
MPLDKRATDLVERDILDLIANGVEEGREIDYKETIKISTDGEKKEFLADVSSFANAAGGSLVFGVAETNGLPTAVKSLAVANWDAERLRIESLVRDGISPRITLDLAVISVSPSGHVLVLRIPRSWTGPHMVSFQHTGKFYSRNSGGKYQLDVGELRSAFTAGTQVAESIRSFRRDRLGAIISGETPVRIPDTARLVVHVCPYTSTSLGADVDVRYAYQQHALIRPLYSSRYSPGFNLDGVVTCTPDRQTAGLSRSYFQLFRDGKIEGVDSILLRVKETGKTIPSVAVEAACTTFARRTFQLYRLLEVQPPAAVMISLLGVKSYRMGVGASSGLDGAEIDRDAVILAPQIAESYDVDPAWFLRSTFDALWNAAGMSQCDDYDSNGRPLEDLQNAIRSMG